MSTLLPEVTALFRPAKRPTLREQLHDLWRFTSAVSAWGPNYATWFLGGASKAEALMYEAFDQNGVTTAAYAVLRTRNDGSEAADDIGIWNGEDGAKAAGIGYTLGAEGRPWTVNLRPRVDPLITWQAVADVVQAAVKAWSPMVVTAFPSSYFPKKVFKDRPGVGWMLYLPMALTTEQVPEARALVPVVLGGRVGTIIVSVIDEQFSDDNPEHVKIANAIEIRLVDQDLLPRYADL